MKRPDPKACGKTLEFWQDANDPWTPVGSAERWVAIRDALRFCAALKPDGLNTERMTDPKEAGQLLDYIKSRQEAGETAIEINPYVMPIVISALEQMDRQGPYEVIEPDELLGEASCPCCVTTLRVHARVRLFREGES